MIMKRSDLSAIALAQIAPAMPRKSLAAGEVLFHKGDYGRDCYIVVEGLLEVVNYLDGQEIQLEICDPGEMIGEMALIDTAPRSATVRALTDSWVAILNEEDFFSLLRNDATLAVEMLRRGTERLRVTAQILIARLEAQNAELSQANKELKQAQDELIYLNRIQEEMKVARRIQKFFLPRKLPQPAGWEVAAFNRGAQAIGGDFFDCIELLSGQLGLVIADACGKGVPAALFVALTRSLIHASSQAPWVFREKQTLDMLDSDDVLISSMWFTNDYIAREHGESNMFITTFYGVLDVQTGRLTYVNAGHNPPMVVNATGTELHELDGTCLPLGIIENMTFETVSTNLESGETFVSFSDGITEAMNIDGDLYGEDRLRAVIREQAEQSAQAQQMVDAIVQDVDAYVATAPQSDDMTILVVRRTSPSASML